MTGRGHVNPDDSGLNFNKDDKSRFFVNEFATSILIAGKSAATVEELRMIKLVAASQCNPILVVGQTGTGKEMAARAVHQVRHPQERFVAVNCAALTANLLESELFGHVKGAFTGADKEKAGLFELAGEGTIFLDEISEMPLDLQAKLLRVLQEKTFRKVGGTRYIECKATIVASSNRDLRADVQEKKFRQDLFYRLSVCPIVLAPLRAANRREDILLLAEYFLATSDACPEKKGKIRSLTKLAAQTLQKHSWPGNVRELKNVIDRAIVLETTDKIGLSSIIIDPEEDESRQDYPITADIKDFTLSHTERKFIARALKQTGWKKTQTASLLGITRATLYAKVKQYNLEKPPKKIASHYPREGQAEETLDVEDLSLARAEREIITRALEETGWEMTEAAALLGIGKRTLHAKIKEYNIESSAKEIEDSLDEITGPLQVYIDSDVYTSEEKAEILSLLSELYSNQSQDRLVIDSEGNAEYVYAGIVVPNGGLS